VSADCLAAAACATAETPTHPAAAPSAAEPLTPLTAAAAAAAETPAHPAAATSAAELLAPFAAAACAAAEPTLPASLGGCATQVQKEVSIPLQGIRPTPPITFLDLPSPPPPSAPFNLTRKHWLSPSSFHSTTLVPHPANLPEPSWSKLTLATRTHERDEYLSPRPCPGSPCLGCTRQSTHAVTVSAPSTPMPMPMPISMSASAFPTTSPTPAAVPFPPAHLLSSSAAPFAAPTGIAAPIPLLLTTTATSCSTVTIIILSVATLAMATTAATAITLLPPLLLMLPLPRARRHRAAAITVQAAWRGRSSRSALHDLHRVCDELRHQPGEHLEVNFGAGEDFCAVLVRPGLMDAYLRCEGRSHVRDALRYHMITLGRATVIVQSSFRWWLVRRCLLPAATLVRQIALSREMCRTPVDPARTLTPVDLYLRPVEGGLSWVYCDRDTRFDVVDALALLRPRPVRTAGHASNAAQRARQHAAFEKETRDWRRWRRTTLAWCEVTEVRGRLYRPRGSGRYNKKRYEVALASTAAGPTPRALALDEWRRAGRDEALFAGTWDLWWSDCAPSLGFHDFDAGTNADVDDYVLAGSEDESVRESDAQSDDEFDITDLGMI
jgi:hypothetical protein